MPAQLDDRLVVDAQLVALERAVQRVLGLEPQAGRRAHLLVEELPAALARVPSRWYIAASASRSRVSGLSPGPGDRDADARAEVLVLAVELDRRLDDLEQPFGHIDRLPAGVLGVEVVAQDRELVAAESGHGVAGPDRGTEARAELDHELVAGVVAEAVVHELEAVEVEEQDRGRGLASAGCGAGPGSGTRRRAAGSAGR